MKILPERLLKLMSPKDRRTIGQQSADEAVDAYGNRFERDEQRLFSNWLLRHENDGDLFWCASASHKPVTIRVGWPDFQVHRRGKSLFIEMKAPGGRLSEEQHVFQNRIKMQGFPYVIAKDAKEAIAAVNRHLL